MSGKPILGILLGDAAGVGPEIIAKLAASRFYDEYCRPEMPGYLREVPGYAAWKSRCRL